jgi:hypothetical protein
MLCHLRMIEDVRSNGERWLTYADPDLPENWIDDPCTFCGGESFSAQCPGDHAWHRHGKIHLPERFGPDFGALCKSPQCAAKAQAAWNVEAAKNTRNT